MSYKKAFDLNYLHPVGDSNFFLEKDVLFRWEGQYETRMGKKRDMGYLWTAPNVYKIIGKD